MVCCRPLWYQLMVLINNTMGLRVEHYLYNTTPCFAGVYGWVVCAKSRLLLKVAAPTAGSAASLQRGVPIGLLKAASPSTNGQRCAAALGR